MMKKLLLALILGVFSLSNNFVAADDGLWSSRATIAWYEGHEDDDVFTIYTAAELAGLAKLVNEGTESFEGKTIQLGDHLNLGDYAWVPIGIFEKPFMGSFDGKGYTISGLKIDERLGNSYDSRGLFGVVQVSTDATICFSNVTLSAANGACITGISNTDASTAAFIGYAIQKDVTTIIRLTISNCHNAIPVSAMKANEYSYTAGLVGVTNAAIQLEGCTNSGKISAKSTNTYVGGFMGISFNIIEISKCANSGIIKAEGEKTWVGGLIAHSISTTTIDNCLNSGDITANGTSKGYAGGLIAQCNSEFILSSSYSAASISCTTNGFAGGLAGSVSVYNTKISISDCFSAGSVSGMSTTTTGGVAGYIYQNGANSSISLSNNLVMLSELKGETVNRIVGRSNKTLYASNNYAYIQNPTVYADNTNGVPGTDWSGYIYRRIIDGLNFSSNWSFDETHRLLPKLKSLGSNNVDVFNLMRRVITWNVAGGIPALSTTIGMVDNPIKPIFPKREGYRFDGWYIKTGNDYILWNFDTPISDNMTLYAQWVKEWNVSFDTRGGSVLASQIIEDGMSVSKPADPIRAGYAFLGWTSSAESTTPDWDFNTPINEDITICAVWQPLLSADFITIEAIATQIYTGKPLTPTVTVRRDKELLQSDMDYTVSYRDNIEIGTGAAIISGKGIYGGATTVYFPIIAPTQVVSLTIDEVENATTIPAAGTSWYQLGLMPEITILPNEGFSLKYLTLYLNDEQIYPTPLRSVEVTEEDNVLILRLGKLTENVRLRIEGISPVSIAATAADFSLSLQPGGIRIDASRSSSLQVVCANGVPELLRTLPAGTTFVGLAPGAYIIRIENRSWKVVIVD